MLTEIQRDAIAPRGSGRQDAAGATTPIGTRGAPTQRPSPQGTVRRLRDLVRRAWPVLRWLVGLALLGLALDVLSGHKGELSGIGTTLAHLRWWWVAPAVAAETASELSFVVVQQRLLSAGGLSPPLRPLTGVTLASQAMTSSVPGGAAVAAVYGFRWYRRFGADDTLAGWALVGTSISAALSLALLAGVGLVLATEEGASLDLVPAVIGVLVVTLALGVLFVYERPLALAARWALRLSHRLIRRPRGDREQHIERLLAQVAAVRITPGQGVVITGWAFANWLFDCTCFGLAFLATGSAVPWKGLLLAYGAGQLAANLPITPGGLGAVEGSITIALSYFGGATTADIAAVLVYRLISFWLTLVVGWGAWGGLAVGVRRGRWARSALGAPVEPHVLELERQGTGWTQTEGPQATAETSHAAPLPEAAPPAGAPGRDPQRERPPVARPFPGGPALVSPPASRAGGEHGDGQQSGTT
jgi:uncharacterized membrane protein YbhN (UPF0104 family)